MSNLNAALELDSQYRLLDPSEQARGRVSHAEALYELGYTADSLVKARLASYFTDNPVTSVREISDPSIGLATIGEEVAKPGNSLIFLKPNETVVYTGLRKDIDLAYCEENQIPILDLGFMGGTIVSSSDDLGMGFLLNHELGGMEGYIRGKIADFLQPRVDGEIVENRNDLMLNGFKFSGAGRGKIGSKHLYYFQVTFTAESDRIEKICQKPMKKKPKGLLDFGEVTRDELLADIKDWTNSNG